MVEVKAGVRVWVRRLHSSATLHSGFQPRPCTGRTAATPHAKIAALFALKLAGSAASMAAAPSVLVQPTMKGRRPPSLAPICLFAHLIYALRSQATYETWTGNIKTTNLIQRPANDQEVLALHLITLTFILTLAPPDPADPGMGRKRSGNPRPPRGLPWERPHTPGCRQHPQSDTCRNRRRRTQRGAQPPPPHRPQGYHKGTPGLFH